jgi:dihydropteroate synthase
MTINCKGILVDLSTPIMGILNNAQLFLMVVNIKWNWNLSQVEKMLLDGATFIDVGAHSKAKCRICIEQEEISENCSCCKFDSKHSPKP